MLKLSNVVEFETENQQYLYDTITSRVINTTKEQTFLIKNFFLEESNFKNMNSLFNINEDEYKKMKLFIESLINKYNMFYYDSSINNKSELSIEETKELTYNSPLSQLILIVTENCNLRCEYCVYSDKYPKDISYSNLKMDFKTAKLAIDEYFKLHREREKHGLNKSPNISFYGGEPLLNFDLIKECVNYIKEIDPSTVFYITTNGTIMNNEIAHFLATNNFVVTFSLDGNKENNDRNRIFINQKGTFDIIYNNVKKLKSTMIELNNTNPISFNCCFDLYTDLEKVVEFFEKNYYEFNPFFITYAPIKKQDTTYYQWCDDKFKNSNIFSKNNLYNSKKNIEQKLLYSNEVNKEYKEVAAPLFLGELSFYIRSKSSSLGVLRNSCIPLSKIAVTSEGKIFLCEKMCEKLPVGDLINGIDWERVQLISNNLIKFFNSNKCSNCKAKVLCEACFMYLDDDGSINESFCSEKLNNFEKELAHHYKLYEDNVDFISLLKDNKENINKIKEINI